MIYPAPAALPRTRAAIANPSRILVRLLHRLALGRRDGVRPGVLLGPFATGGTGFSSRTAASGLGTCASGAREALSGVDFIDPDSSIIQGHELHIAIKLQAGIQVGNPDRCHLELCIV